ncbi:hypothetical protein CANCADRAFT_84899 [Tortispora caseinolytica NRRL Y-17796]|uniref:Presequence translocated-associated motor subunit PAM17 n=1 Tax=Tortispora caseinolytica NRRL Y-17796 TaxID=767744 RepID=A0A1E4TKR4_9ASCO|nr:hypothetical protein CANCADRAFT_84899 [Tortispora caseinolytica NRRL Y-17796]
MLTRIGCTRAFGLRYASTAASPAAMTWDRFLAVRSMRRRINLGSSAAMAVVGSSVAWSYAQDIELDPTKTFMGVDMLYVMLGGIIASGAAAFVIFGPLVGQAIFRCTYLLRSQTRAEFLAKENTFLQHIKKNRVDPRYQSMSNPVPDYYGEKIRSVADYRRWLKDCKAYNRKASTFVI